MRTTFLVSREADQEARSANPEGEKECPSLPGLGIKLLRLVSPLCTLSRSAAWDMGWWAPGMVAWGCRGQLGTGCTPVLAGPGSTIGVPFAILLCHLRKHQELIYY